MLNRKLRERLEAHGQQHVLAFWDQLDAAQRAGLVEQLEQIDLDLIERLAADDSDQPDFSELARRAQPPPAIRLSAGAQADVTEAGRASGREALAAGTVGAVLVAGGQGSRLGFDLPKGMFPIGPLSGASLFQILLEKIAASSRRYASRVPLFVMTSPATDAPTREYLDSNDYFGLPAEDVVVFCQGTMPAVAAESGRLILADRDQLFLSPDGHGGMLAALRRSGAWGEMQRRGLRHLFYFQVDNPLGTVCDPELIGHHILANSQYTLQVVARRQADDKVGNVVSIDGTAQIIEYSDLPAEAAGRRAADGSLELWAGSIAVHVFDIDFLAASVADGAALPFHRALKKVPYVDAAGQRIDPHEANAIKFEQFIFDLLPRAAQTLSVEVERDAAFAPLKNAPGSSADTQQHVQQQMMALDRARLRACGVEVADSVRVEISPLFALDIEQLKAKLGSGMRINQDTYFR